MATKQRYHLADADNEFRQLEIIVLAMENLTPHGRRRVVAYLLSRYGDCHSQFCPPPVRP
jgi:hypothetical protein